MRSIFVRLIAAAAVAGTVTVGAASTANAHGPCRAGFFCAFDGNDYSGELLESNAPAGSDHISVARDRVNSGINHTANYWCAVNDGFPGDQTIWSFAPGSHVRTMGAQYNKTDWFYVRTRAQQCD
ncbi:peptidase inhibitor family I36 protein [Kibdelosporangium aridum]|uniref:peptidase inhibitor family I36 protein n=1 Tax=Kibdelosporangium aridum TaxID=2030 RepID=UPI0035EAE43A